MNKTREIQILVNGKRADIYSMDKLNLRLNNILCNLSQITTIKSEYSFTFTLPLTKKNNTIFDFSNEKAKMNKFGKTYDCQIYSNEIKIFDGSVLISSINNEGYKCNLFVNKNNTVESIFGDSLLTEINDWKIDYDQDITINKYNNGMLEYPQDCIFPLVAYGMFQKEPMGDEQYTSKFLIDDYNRFYNENFYPSLNLLKTVKKCFESKGYEVDGDIFDDESVKKIFMSTNLTDKQEPFYNWGEPKMGECTVNFTYNNYDASTQVFANSVYSELEHPKFFMKVEGEDRLYYYTHNNIYDIFSSDEKYLKALNYDNDIMWRENRLVAPASGYYKIEFDYDYQLDPSKTFETYGYEFDGNRTKFKRYVYTPSVDFTNFFVEFQLIKNSKDGTDTRMIMPDAIDEQYSRIGSGATINTSNRYMYSAYPHCRQTRTSVSSQVDKYPFQYIPKDNGTLGYDPSVNKNFICGVCTSGPYHYNSVIKNGKSWNPECSDTNKSRYTADGYYGIKVTTSAHSSTGRRGHTAKSVEETEYGKSILPNAVNTISVTDDRRCNGKIQCIVYLDKNDYIQLKMLQRKYDNKITVDALENERAYSSRINDTDRQTDAVVNITGTIKMSAFSPDDIGITSEYFDWNNASRYDTKLNLPNFLNGKEKMSDFINNFIKEFNLSFKQDKKLVTLDIQKLRQDVDRYAVDLTRKVNDGDITILSVDYPSSIQVEYTVNEDEYGVYDTADKNAPMGMMETNKWKDYADYGSDKVELAEYLNYSNNQKLKTKTSYTYYGDYKLTASNQNKEFKLPVIAKDEWMIEHYKDEEMMRHQGYSLPRRYWYPKELLNEFLVLNRNYKRRVNILTLTNVYKGNALNYKEGKNTLLGRFFNILYNTDSNEIQFETYLDIDEYINIKNGALIIVNKDVYIPIEIQGFDASGNNMTSIIALKK